MKLESILKLFLVVSTLLPLSISTVNDSYCCDNNNNLVFKSFMTYNFDYQWSGYDESSVLLHDLLELIGDGMFSEQLPQAQFAKLYVRNRENETTVTMEDIRTLFHDYGFENTGYTLFISIASIYCGFVAIAVGVIITLWILKRSFTTLRQGKIGFYILCGLMIGLSVLIMPAIVLWRQNGSDLEDSYPDRFMNRVGRINRNIQGYILSASEEINYLRAEQLTFTFQQIQSNLDDLPSLTFQPVETKILGDITVPMNTFDQALELAKSDWDSLLLSYDRMMNATQDVSNAVFDAKSHLNSMRCTTSDPECSQAGLLSGDVTRHENYFTDEMTNPLATESFAIFQTDVVSDVNQSIYQEMDLMVDAINTSVSSAVQDMTNMATSAKETTDELIVNVSSDINVTLSPFDLENYLWHPWTHFHSQATDYLDSVRPYYMAARVMAIVVCMAGIMLPIVAMAVWRQKPPRERNIINHILGFVVLGYSIVAVLCSILYMIYAIMMFWETSPYLRACSQMSSNERRMDFIDEPFVVDNETENFFASQILANVSAPLTFASILSDCFNNAPLYMALQLSLSAKYDIEGTLDVSSLLPGAATVFDSATPDISQTVLVPDSLKNILTAFDNTTHDTTLNDMNTTATEVIAWYTQLKDGQPGVTVTCGSVCQPIGDIKDQLQSFINQGIEPTAARTEAQSAASVLTDIVDVLLPSMHTLSIQFQSNKTQLQKSLAALKDAIDSTFLPAENTLQIWIANDATPMLETSVAQVGSNVEKYLGNYVDWVMGIFRTQLGTCGQVADAYDYFWDFTCDQIVKTANMQWLGSVWVSVCLLGMSLTSFTLSFYLFRSNRASTKSDEIEDKVSVVENETMVTTAEEKMYTSQPTTASKSRRSSMRSMSVDTDAGTGSTHDTWVHSTHPLADETPIHRVNRKQRRNGKPRTRNACTETDTSRRISEDQVVPTLLLGGGKSPTPSDVLNHSSASKPPMSTRSRGAVSHIMKFKRARGEGQRSNHQPRPRSAPGNFLWNKIVFVGSRGSTNLFATTTSSREDSIADGLSDYAESAISTPKQAWSLSMSINNKKRTEETNIPSAEEVNTNKQDSQNKQPNEVEENIAEHDRVTPLNFDKIDNTPKDGNETGELREDSKEDLDSQRPRHSSEAATRQSSTRNSVAGPADEDSSTEADRVYFTRTPSGMKSMTPVVLATHKRSSLENNNTNINNNSTENNKSATPGNEIQSGEVSERVTNSRESAIKEVGSDFEHEGEEDKSNMGQNGSQEESCGNVEGRSIKKQNTNTSISTHDNTLDITALRSVEDSPLQSPKSTSEPEYPVSNPQQPRVGAWGSDGDEEIQRADLDTSSNDGPHGLPPLPFTTTGAIRRESTLPMMDEVRVQSGRTKNSVIVYRHAENKKKKQQQKQNKNKNKQNSKPPIQPPQEGHPPSVASGRMSVSDYIDTDEVRSRSGNSSYREVDDTRPGFIDASLLKNMSSNNYNEN